MTEFVRYGKYLRLDSLKKEFFAQSYKAMFFGTDDFYKVFLFQEILPEIAENRDTFEHLMKVIQKTSKLNHANIMRILDFHDFQTTYALINEYFPHEQLITLMSTYYKLGKSIPPVIAVYIAVQVCEALDYTHNMDVIHGNLSPLNILITHEGLIKVKDFDIFSNLSQETRIQKMNFKQYRYLPPEKIQGKPTTPQSDIYNLGVIMYELIAGQAIYSGNSMDELVTQILSGKFKPILELSPNISEDLAKVVEKAISIDPADRYKSATEFKFKLQKFLIQNNKIFSSQLFYSLISKLFQPQIELEIEQNKSYENLQLNSYSNKLKTIQESDDYMAVEPDEDLFDDNEKTSILFDNIEEELKTPLPKKELFDENEKTNILNDEEETSQQNYAQLPFNNDNSQQIREITPKNDVKPQNKITSAQKEEVTNITEGQKSSFDIKSFLFGLIAGIILGLAVGFLK